MREWKPNLTLTLEKSDSSILDIYIGEGKSPIGNCFIAWVNRNDGYLICFLAFVDSGYNKALSDLKALWPRADLKGNDEQAQKIISEIFGATTEANSKPLNLLIKGSEFQEKVWRALTQINFGTVICYEDLAKLIGGKNFTRAAASAVAKNNISYLIPCHRVISKSGAIKYRWGSDFKKKLLGWEKALLA